MMDEQLKKLRVREIKAGRRHRKDMGDIRSLATSIREEGLLQPIGVTADMRLVFGEKEKLMPYRIEYYGGPADGHTNQYHDPTKLPQEVRMVQKSGYRAIYRLVVREAETPAEFDGGKSAIMDFAYEFTHYSEQG
jgi:hypothetical protein